MTLDLRSDLTLEACLGGGADSGFFSTPPRRRRRGWRSCCRSRSRSSARRGSSTSNAAEDPRTEPVPLIELAGQVPTARLDPDSWRARLAHLRRASAMYEAAAWAWGSRPAFTRWSSPISRMGASSNGGRSGGRLAAPTVSSPRGRRCARKRRRAARVADAGGEQRVLAASDAPLDFGCHAEPRPGIGTRGGGGPLGSDRNGLAGPFSPGMPPAAGVSVSFRSLPKISIPFHSGFQEFRSVSKGFKKFPQFWTYQGVTGDRGGGK